MFSRSRSGSQRGGGGGRGKQVEQFDQKLMKVVEMQCDQAGYELPEDEGAVESLLNGTKAYIIAVLKDAVRKTPTFLVLVLFCCETRRSLLALWLLAPCSWRASV